jgi:hypothetical protein
MHNAVVLMGPPTAGKSTQATLLSARLGWPQRSLDKARWAYMADIGYSRDLDNRFRAAGGFLARYLYWSLFTPYAIERFLGDHHTQHVLDLGGAHTIAETDEQQQRLAAALAPFANVFMLLPSPDSARSIAVLNERLAAEPVTLNFEFITHFVTHVGQRTLAKHIIYTDGHTPDATCRHIMALVTP